MLKGRVVFLFLITAAVLCWQIIPGGVNSANGQVDGCTSEASGAGGCYLVCPAGGGTLFSGIPAIIELTVRDQYGNGIPGVPASDIWLDGCSDLCLCGGGGCIDADAGTSANPPGYTTISGSMKAGGCDPEGLIVVIQGVVVGCPATCLPYMVVSPDIDCDLAVNIVDLALFATVYLNQPGGYDVCYDFNCDGLVNIVDFSIFAFHYGCVCS
jgi:hypothetical protein